MGTVFFFPFRALLPRSLTAPAALKAARSLRTDPDDRHSFAPPKGSGGAEVVKIQYKNDIMTTKAIATTPLQQDVTETGSKTQEFFR